MEHNVEELKKQILIELEIKYVLRSDMDALVEKTVRQTLLQLGVNADDPLAMQKDFQYLREWRESVNSIKDKGTWAILTISLTGMASFLVVGFKKWVIGD